MSDRQVAVANAGEQITTPPSALPLKPDEQFRLVNQRLNSLADEISRMAKPPQFRLAETLQLAMIAIGLLIALVGAFSLSDRIADVRTDQAAVERRLNDSIGASEIRLGTKLDKLSDQFSAMDERTSRLEGEMGQKKPH